MIYPYVGDYLISPVPLQLSFNWCSHACSYCFANLNTPGRSFDLPEFQKQLKAIRSNNGLQSVLLRQQYPVLISNLVDPFATSNYGIAANVIEQLSIMGIPVALQTRGAQDKNKQANEALNELIEWLPPSVWYVSVPMLRDEIRKKLEPAAPSIGYRLDLIDRLREAGHKVLAGVNPTVSDWLPEDDGERLLDALKARGVTGIWVAALHFNQKQMKVMPAIDRERLGEMVIKKGLDNARDLRQPCFDYITRLTTYARSTGLWVEGMYDGRENRFFAPFYQTYNKLFPTIHHFINWCWQHKADDEPVYFDEFLKVMTGFPDGEHNLSPYLMCMSQTLVKEVHYKMSYRKLLWLAWNEDRMKRTLERYWSFAVCVEGNEKKLTWHLDSKGNKVYRFHRQGYEDEFVIV